MKNKKRQSLFQNLKLLFPIAWRALNAVQSIIICFSILCLSFYDKRYIILIQFYSGFSLMNTLYFLEVELLLIIS